MFKSKRLSTAFSVLFVIIMAITLTGCPAQPAASTPTAAPAATKAPAATTAAPAATTAPAAAATTAPAAGTPAAAAPTGPAAKVITVYMSQEPDTLFPNIGSMMAKEEVLGVLYTDCIVLDDQNQYQPRGCESVPSVDNGGAKFVGDGADKHLEVTFKLKKYKWSDGNPVTSKDIKFSWDLMLNPDFNAEQRDAALKVADVLTPDDQTAVMVYMSENQAKQAAAKGWKYDNKSFYEGYDTQSGPVIDPLYMISADMGSHFMPSVPLSKIAPKDMEKSDFARNPVGNGPYKLQQWVPAQTLAVQANDNGLYQAKIQTIVFKLVADATAILNGLAAGEGQVTTQVGLDVDQSPEIDKLAQQNKIKPFYIPASAWEHIDFNLQDPLLQDVKVRQAIAYAVDRKTIVDKLLYGKSKVMDTWIAPPHWALQGNDANIMKYDFNPQKAKDLLAQAGWKAGSDGIMEKDGKKLRLKLQTTTAKIRQAIGPLVQANLKDVGIQVDPEYLPGRGLFETNGPLLKHTFQLGLYTWVSNPDPDPTNLYLGKNCPDGANYPCYKNQQFDQLTAQQASELSQPKRAQLIGQLLKIWTNDLPTLPLFQRLNVTAAVPQLQNFKPTPSNTPETWNAEQWFLPAS